MLISVKLPTKYVITIYALGSVHEKFGVWIRPFQSRSKGEIPGRATRKERLNHSKLKQAFLTDSDAELFMYLIQCIRFGSWKVRCLNRALVSLASSRLRFPLQSGIQCFVNDRLISRVERKWTHSEFSATIRSIWLSQSLGFFIFTRS